MDQNENDKRYLERNEDIISHAMDQFFNQAPSQN